MAEAPAGGHRSSPLDTITRKVGPLPVWAYAAILVAAYYLYRRSHPSSGTSGQGAGGPSTTDQAYVPPFDAAGAGGGGGIGDTTLGGTVGSNATDPTAVAQAAGGGTSSADPSKSGTGLGGGGVANNTGAVSQPIYSGVTAQGGPRAGGISSGYVK